jgi:hypothetical protein
MMVEIKSPKFEGKASVVAYLERRLAWRETPSIIY